MNRDFQSTYSINPLINQYPIVQNDINVNSNSFPSSSTQNICNHPSHSHSHSHRQFPYQNQTNTQPQSQPQPQPQSYPLLNISNQVLKEENLYILNNENYFNTKPVITVCPGCKKLTNTKVEKKLNFLSVFSCILNPVYWLAYQSIEHKHFSFNDSSHLCCICNYKIKEFSACHL